MNERDDLDSDSDSTASSDFSLDDLVDEDVRSRIEESLDHHSPMAPLRIPPIPLEDSREAVGDEDEYLGRVFALTDLAEAFNKAVDPTMAQEDEWDEETEEWVDLDEPRYPLTDQSVIEVKIATHLLNTAYSRDLEDLADTLGVANLDEHDSERGYDYNEAIKDYFDYEWDKDYEKPIRWIADDLDVAPEEVADALADRFGEDEVEQFEIRDPDETEFASVDDIEELLDSNDEGDADEEDERE